LARVARAHIFRWREVTTTTDGGFAVNDQLEALLALQTADVSLMGLERRLAELTPRIARLDSERESAAKAVQTAREAVTRERERHGHLSERAQEFRRMNERAVGQLDQVRKAAHATAAGAQVDISRRALAEAEAELHASGLRMSTLQHAAEAAEERTAHIDEEQAPARAEVQVQRAEIERELKAARGGRDALARAVDARLLSKYDRVRGRRHGPAVFALHNFTCGNCDTAIPTQRRAGMAAGAIEVCESCGVLLYAPAPAAAAAH
jgi:predicted  nucleic acid-binding Zn-ribbon protein